jgi:hypothetical protein
MSHQMTDDGESTERWAMRQPDFIGTVKRLLCCARCGESLPGGPNRTRKVFSARPLLFICDDCYEALP